MKNGLRWALFVPIALLIGALATFPLHWLIYLAFDKDSLLYNYREEIEYSIYPFVIGHVFVRAGSFIAPLKSNNIPKALIVFWILFVAIISFILNIKGFVFTPQSYIGIPLGILGTVTAYWIVTEQYKTH